MRGPKWGLTWVATDGLMAEWEFLCETWRLFAPSGMLPNGWRLLAGDIVAIEQELAARGIWLPPAF